MRKLQKYSKELVKEICGHIEEGSSLKDAANLSGIGESTLALWRSEDGYGDTRNPLTQTQKLELLDAIKKAESINKEKHIKTIHEARHKSWQASAWWLERKYKDEFAVRSEVTGKDGESLQIVLDMPK
jgi:hypothetical protein